MSGTSIRIKLDPKLEHEARRIQASIPADKLFTEYPTESSLFEDYDFDKRERFGIKKGLYISVASGLPSRIPFSDVLDILTSFNRIDYCFESIEFGILPKKRSVLLRFGSYDIQKLRMAFRNYEKDVDLELGFVRKNKTVKIDTELSRGDEFTTNEVEIVYPGEVVKYFLDRRNPWLIDQPLPQNPELVLMGEGGGARG